MLIDKLKELKLSFAHIRGQGEFSTLLFLGQLNYTFFSFDGARSMSGHVKGCASVIQNLYPAALYVHCANHSLNLAIATTCKIPAIRNCIGSMKETVNLFRMSTKAGTLLKNLILESFPNSKQVRLLKFCETRWVEHLESLSLFNDLFPLICTALEELDTENLRSDLSKPHALLTAIQSPQFVIAMAILKPIFALSKHISLCLQQIDCDLSSCVAYANNLYAEISEMRKDSEQSFKLIFESVKTIAAELDLEIKIPRLAKRQTNRDNYEGEPEEYYRRSIYIPFLDHFLDQINERFLKHRELLSKIENILPNKCINLDVIEMQETVRVLEKQWSADVEDPDDFVAEFRMWKRLKIFSSDYIF